MPWDDDQQWESEWWGDCVNTFAEETKQLTYAKKMGLEMHFLAKTVKHNEIPATTFDIPASLKIVSKEEMQKLFDSWQ